MAGSTGAGALHVGAGSGALRVAAGGCKGKQKGHWDEAAALSRNGLPSFLGQREPGRTALSSSHCQALPGACLGNHNCLRLTGAHASTAVTLPAVNSVAQVGASSVGPFCSTGAAEEQLPGPGEANGLWP